MQIITGRFLAAAAAVVISAWKEGRKWSGRSAKNDTKYGRTDSNTRWRLTKIPGYIKSRAFNFSSLNDVIFQPMRSLDLRIRDHVSISAGTL